MCDFHDVHKYIEEKLGRPAWTHEMASYNVQDEIKKAVKPDFISLCRNEASENEQNESAGELTANELFRYIETLPEETYISFFRMMYAGMKKYRPLDLKTIMRYE